MLLSHSGKNIPFTAIESLMRVEICFVAAIVESNFGGFPMAGDNILMKLYNHFFAGAALAVALSFAPVAYAQNSGTLQMGNTTVTVGAGTVILGLPDIEFTKQFDENVAGNPVSGRLKDNEDFIDEHGWNINGAVSTPLGGGKQVTLNGFYARIENDDTLGCTSPASGTATCAWINLVPGTGSLQIAGSGFSTVVNSSRDVDYWGSSLEFTRQLTPGAMGKMSAPNHRYLSAAVDIRGIDQDISLRTTNPQSTGTAQYDEDLDTRYYGAYLAYGGDYSPMLFKGLWNRWGLKSSFQLRGGVYYADTDYDGHLVSNITGFNAIDSRLSLSSNDTAFIGGLVLETSKRIGARSTLSLKSEYEYYSYVPDMSYNDNDGGNFSGPNVGTSIGDDSAFSAKTMLRLTIKLGPKELMEPLK